MQRSIILSTVVFFVLSSLCLIAEDGKKTIGSEKTKVTKPKSADIQKKVPKESGAVKGKQSITVEKKQSDKSVTKKSQAAKQLPAVVTSDTEYYTDSPAQGRPADGLVKAGTKLKLVEKAGSYVRVILEIEAYVAADSFKSVEEVGKKAAPNKETLKKAPEKKGVETKTASVDQAALKKKLEAAAGDKQNALKKKTNTKQAVKEQPVDHDALKKKLAAKEKAATEKKGSATTKPDKKEQK